MANGWFRKRKMPEELPEGLWIQCEKCRQLLFRKEWERNLKVCHKCSFHFRLTAVERVDLLLDEDSFQEMDAGLTATDPLDFPRYRDSLDRYQSATGMRDAVLTGEGTLEGHPLTISITDAHFMMGTMGSVVGERIARAMERATERRIPALLISGTGGGARMQEGLLSLMQMAKTAGAIARHHAAGQLTVVLLTDPSMAGVLASWGSLGDVVFAEPGAMVGFVGQRVSRQAQVSKVPADFQTAEFQMKHGQVDRVVPRRELVETLASVFRFAGVPVVAGGSASAG